MPPRWPSRERLRVQRSPFCCNTSEKDTLEGAEADRLSKPLCPELGTHGSVPVTGRQHCQQLQHLLQQEASDTAREACR